MRLALLSSRFPCGNNEPFLGEELASIVPMLEHTVIVPLRPSHAMHGTGGAFVMLLHPLSPRTWIFALRTFLRAPKAALLALRDVSAHSRSVSVLLKNLVIFPRALAIAHMLHRERIDHVHAYWLSTPATAAMIVARVNGISWSATAHRWDIFERNMIPEKAASARFIRTISERGRTELCRIAPDCASTFAVVRLGTAIVQTAQVTEIPRRHEFRILCAAAFRPVKGHRVLLDAFAQAYERRPALSLTLCGEGPLESTTRARARALPCSDAITFRGYVEHEHLLYELREGMYDAVVLASIDDGVALMEGVPSILIEASSLSVACIATRSGAIAELLSDDDAFLAQPGDVPSLRDAILAAANAPDRLERAARAAERARALHDPGKRAAELIELFGVSA